MKGSVTIDQAIRSYMVGIGKPTLHGYLRYAKYMIDFLRTLSMNHEFMEKTELLKLDQKKSINFPDDCQMPRMIAWPSGDRIIGFQVDSRINLTHSYCDDAVAGTLNSPYDPHQNWPYNGQGQMSNLMLADGTITSLGVNVVGYNGLGYFRINWKDREIQFSSDTPSNFKIYLSYRSNGFAPKSNSTIPEFAAKLGEEYIHWQVARYKFGDASAEAKAREERYLQEYDDMIRQTTSLSYEDIVGTKARSFDVNKMIG